MGRLELDGKIYQFTWFRILLLFLIGPGLALFIYYGFDWIWLHEITAKLTIWSLNLLTNGHNIVYNVNELYGYVVDAEQPWRILMFLNNTDEELGPIAFEDMCTGIHAIAMFFAIILATPHSLDKTANKGIWGRKAIAILITTSLFYIVNIMRMWLQLYLYSIGYEWEKIHYSISAASSFIAIAAILVMHKFLPEFIMSLLWIADEVRIIANKNKTQGVIIAAPLDVHQENNENKTPDNDESHSP
jgi:exosortase/archaeosortase family protein